MNFSGQIGAAESDASETATDNQPSQTKIGWAHWAYRQRWRLLFIVLPTLLAAIYYGTIASDVYISESRFVIKAPNKRQAQLTSIANLIQTTGLSGGQEQANEVLEYLNSRNALSDVEKTVNVRAMFGTSLADPFERYPQPFQVDAFENLYKFYEHMVSARVDKESGAAVLTVNAFRPEDAERLNAALLDLSERLVNRLNDRAQKKEVAEAQQRVTEAQDRVREARIALQNYRNKSAILDPVKQGAAVLEVSTQLVAEQAVLRAQLETTQRIAPHNPSIPALRQRIAAISAQIDVQDGRAVGTKSGLASKLSEYENLLVEQEFATQMLTSTNASLEQARAEAQSQQFYLERVVEPNRPDLPLLPKRVWSVLVVFISCVSMYMVGWMLIVGILEHAPEN